MALKLDYPTEQSDSVNVNGLQCRVLTLGRIVNSNYTSYLVRVATPDTKLRLARHPTYGNPNF